MSSPTPQPTPSPASADPGSRLDDLRDLAASTQERLAREQDAYAASGLTDNAPTSVLETWRAALATSRGEAARAMEALFLAIPVDTTEQTLAAEQWGALRGSAPIPSATLREWTAAWRGAAS
jgi:hypothetical protein